jgi:hypothetical protein
MKQRKVCFCIGSSVGYPSATYRVITVVSEWSVDKRGMHNALYETLAARNARQGKRFAARAAKPSMSLAFDHQQGASF